MVSKCVLCRLGIDSRCLKPYENEYWRGLRKEDPDLFNKSPVVDSAHSEAQFHEACWLVAQSQPQLKVATDESKRQFYSIAQEFNGLLFPLHTSVEPQLDFEQVRKSRVYDIFALKQEQMREQYTSNSRNRIFRLPCDIIDRIFWELQDHEDFGKLSFVSGRFPSEKRYEGINGPILRIRDSC